MLTALKRMNVQYGQIHYEWAKLFEVFPILYGPFSIIILSDAQVCNFVTYFKLWTSKGMLSFLAMILVVCKNKMPLCHGLKLHLKLVLNRYF